MMKNFLRLKSPISILVAIIAFSQAVSGQKFSHPGIDQSARDLAQMKKLVSSNTEPYKSAFTRLKAVADSGFVPNSHAHVLRGPYGRPNIGGNDLSKSAAMAYNYALVWYITNDKAYANKAIEILNKWSPVLWHLDYNDAKLLAAWTGHALCNAAEILKYSHAGWQQKDMDSFSDMLMTVYYPLMRFYYPQANGNWDGAIIHSILAIAVFTDNRKMFDNAIDHYLHAPVNGSIFKYIYPGGQCQETMRDQAHVQLGLGEFAGAGQIAFTQGVDFFSIASNRIALGYEYTASFLLGEMPHSYGRISERAKNLRDDYEYVYRHYTGIGVEVPFTKRAADSVRLTANRSVLTSVRETYGPAKPAKLKHGVLDYIAGAGNAPANPANSIPVTPGASVQSALDEAAGAGRAVLLKSGVHKLSSTLKFPSGVTLAGEGLNTILYLDPASDNRETIVNKEDDLHDITIRDLVIECALKPEIHSDPNSTRSFRGGYNRGGVLFRSTKGSAMKNINLVNLTIQNSTYNGLYISGASKITITNCNFSENGGSVPPGSKLLHNLLLTHSDDITVKNSRFVTSPQGAGISLEDCNGVAITNSEIARNGYYGLLVAESKNISVTGNLIEANDRSGIMTEYLFAGSENISITDNLIHYNAGYGVESYAVKSLKVEKNTYAGNGKSSAQEKISTEKYILME